MKDFGRILKQRREAHGVGLRELARDADGMDPAYLWRIEHGPTRPRRPTVEKLVQAFCKRLGLDKEACGQLSRELMEAAGYLPAKDDLDLFADRLRAEGLNEAHVSEALSKVPAATMRRVLAGHEPLKIQVMENFDANEQRAVNPKEDIVELSAFPKADDSAADYLRSHASDFDIRAKRRPGPERIAAGPRARIVIRGRMNGKQREQVEQIAKLLKTVLDEE